MSENKKYDTYNVRLKIADVDFIKERYNVSSFMRALIEITVNDLKKNDISTLRTKLKRALKGRESDGETKCPKCKKPCVSEQGLLKHLTMAHKEIQQ